MGAIARQADSQGWRFRLIGTTSVLHESPPDWYTACPIEPLLAQVITKINERGSVAGEL
jgi:hypothetical protein